MLDQMNRRQMLQFSAGSMAFLLGMPVRTLLAQVNESAAAARAEHVILLWMGGGMSHIDTFDPKPGRPTAGDFKPIRTSVPGIDISEILPKMAAQMKHAALIRSVAGKEGEHERAAYHVLTNYQISPQFIHPGMGSIVAHELEQVGDLPSFVSVGGRAPAAGYLGQRCEAYYVGSPGQPDPYVVLPEGITEVRANRRLDLLRNMNEQFEARHHRPQLDATSQSYAAAEHFMHSPALSAFDLEQESPGVREAYGDTSFGRGCLLARRLVENGVRFVQVNTGGFDTHYGNFPAMERLSSAFDPAAGALISDLAASGLLKKTLVVMLSEFGRSPKINGNAGRDHHYRVFSVFMAGGGIKSGTLLGASDADGYAPAEHAVSVGDIHATVCHCLGVDPSKTVDTPLGRPMRLVDQGKPITGLIS